MCAKFSLSNPYNHNSHHPGSHVQYGNSSQPALGVSRPRPRPYIHTAPTQDNPLASNRRQPPNFDLPPTFGIIPPEIRSPYIPPVSPVFAAQSDSDSLPETQHIAGSKSLGKRRANSKTPEDGDGPELKGKKRGKKRGQEDDEEDDEAIAKPKKKANPRVSKAKPAPKKKVKAEPKLKVTKGRMPGSRNFSDEEVLHVLHWIGEKLPIGGAGWQWVAQEYNKWAVKYSYAERDHKSIKAKFDAVRGISVSNSLSSLKFILSQLVRLAKSKPTGDANRDPKTNPLAIALAIEREIDNKVGTLTLNDPEFDEIIGENSDSDTNTTVIEISDDDDKPAVESTKKSKSRAPPKDTVMTKAYRVTEPLAEVPRRPRNSAATEALSSITGLFNPTTMRERDDNRLAQNIHLTQLAATQQEVRELRARNDVLNDRLINETRRADRAESQVQLFTTLQQSTARSRRHRRPSPESSGYDSTPVRSHTRHRTRYSSPSRHPRSSPYSVKRAYGRSRHRDGHRDEPKQHELLHFTRDSPQQQSPSPLPSSRTSAFFGQQPPPTSPGPSKVYEPSEPVAGPSQHVPDDDFGVSITFTPRRGADES